MLGHYSRTQGSVYVGAFEDLSRFGALPGNVGFFDNALEPT